MSGAPRTTDLAVVVDNVTKQFRMPHERVHTLKERVLHPHSLSRYSTFEALGNVSFTVKKGEFFGILGRNGSGKSTLLKCLAGIYGVDRGTIALAGSLSPFIELGVGFNPDLAAKDNVLLNGVMMGLSPSAALDRFDAVIEFAGLEQFVDLKLKNYSSGMHVRLAFAVMIQVNADILLIDEVLAVGDAAFQEKCFAEFRKMREEGRTILFVSHDVAAVKRFCHRAVLLDNGHLIMEADPSEVADRYLEVSFAAGGGAATQLVPGGDDQSSDVVFMDAWFEVEGRGRTDVLPHGSRCEFHARVAFRRAARSPVFTLMLEDVDERLVFVAVTAIDAGGQTDLGAGEQAEVEVKFKNEFAAGRYFVTLRASVPTEGLVKDRKRATSILVTGGAGFGGVVEIEHSASATKVPSESVSGVVGNMTSG